MAGSVTAAIKRNDVAGKSVAKLEKGANAFRMPSSSSRPEPLLHPGIFIQLSYSSREA